jgi:arylsulfatase A-like enzyme
VGQDQGPLPLSDSSSAFARLSSGAATGALALAVLAAVDIALRLGETPALTSPLRDLSLLAAGGALCGAVLGALRLVAILSWLCPFGLVLGAAVALRLWLPDVTGSRLLGERSLVWIALAGAGWVLGGAAIGQLACARLRRALPLRAHLGRDLVIVAALLVPLALPRFGGSSGSVRPNLLLLTVDTLRSDRLGFAGSPRPTSPNLDRLARSGVTYTRAVTPLPRTLPALASLMTGAFPHTHGVRDNFHYALGERSSTLAEMLQASGWATAAVNSNPVLSHDSGIYQGFATASDRGDDWSRLELVRTLQHVRALLAMRAGTRAEVITDLALGWLRSRPRGRPFFLWVHWLAPHMPYEPDPIWVSRFSPDYEGDYRLRLDYDKIPKGEMTYRNPLTPQQREHAAILYDGEIATTDRAVGRLLRELAAAGDLENTIIVFTSDHGESLVEHGYFFNHGDFVYGPATNIPLLVRGLPSPPPGALVRGPTALNELSAPLQTALTGKTAGMASPLPPGVGPFFGESGFCRFPDLNDRLELLLPREIAQNPDRIPDWPQRWEAAANRAKQQFIEEGHWKLVRSPGRIQDRFELFDLDSDPGETRDLSALRPDVVAHLAEKLAEWTLLGETQGEAAAPRTIDDDLRDRMKALGYIGD